MTANRASWKQAALGQEFNAVQDYDWTFSSDYSGATSGSTAATPGAARKARTGTRPLSLLPTLCYASPVEKPNFIKSSFSTKVEYEASLQAQGDTESQWRVHEGSGLDMDLLRRRDIPILHFVDLPLYEDEMDDNGESVVRVRLRVMPTCFLVLLRHALRIDGVLIRHHDTRIFHKFGTPHVLRARRLAEAPLQPLPLPKPEPVEECGDSPAPAATNKALSAGSM